MDILATAKKIVKTLDTKRASDITLLKIEELHNETFLDYLRGGIYENYIILFDELQ